MKPDSTLEMHYLSCNKAISPVLLIPRQSHKSKWEVFKMAKLMQNVELCHEKINITKWLVTCAGQLNNGSEQEIILKDI